MHHSQLTACSRQWIVDKRGMQAALEAIIITVCNCMYIASRLRQKHLIQQCVDLQAKHRDNQPWRRGQFKCHTSAQDSGQRSHVTCVWGESLCCFCVWVSCNTKHRFTHQTVCQTANCVTHPTNGPLIIAFCKQGWSQQCTAWGVAILPNIRV